MISKDSRHLSRAPSHKRPRSRAPQRSDGQDFDPAPAATYQPPRGHVHGGPEYTHEDVDWDVGGEQGGDDPLTPSHSSIGKPHWQDWPAGRRWRPR